MISITSKTVSFYTVLMNFLMPILDNINYLFIVTYKFLKRITIISEKSVYSIEQWVALLLKRFQLTDWDMLLTIIFNHDFKFLFDFWRASFKRLKVNLLISTTCYAQRDEQFERINQTVKITVCFFVTANIDIILILSVLQAQFNNFTNVFTKRSTNEIIYKFKVRVTLILDRLYTY